MEDVSLNIDQIEENLSISRGERPDINIDLKKIGQLPVIDEFGITHKFETLYQKRKTIIIFIRHFLCFITKEYVDDLAIIPDKLLKEADVDLVVIGCGEHNYIQPFRNTTGYRGPLYVDPTLTLHKTIGLLSTHKKQNEMTGVPKYSVHVKSNALSGILKSTWRGMKYRQMQGNMDQQGGALILGPGAVLHYHHFDSMAYDHAPINDLLSLASVPFVNFPKDKRVLTL